MKPREYSKTMDNRMFDFADYYYNVACGLQDGCQIVECGVADGASAIYLAESILNLGKTIGRFVLIDNLAYGGTEQLTTLMRHIQKSKLGDVVEIMPLDSLNASLKFNDKSLDFVFLDSGHTYELTHAEIRLWYPKLKDDGILSGHDYSSQENPGVGKAVLELLPLTILRQPLYYEGKLQQEFQPESFLQVIETEKKLNVWSVKKKFYFNV